MEDFYNAKTLKEIRRRQEIEKAEMVRRTVLMQFLTKEARERLNRVRLAHPELATQFEFSLFQAVQTNQLNKELTDEQVKEILEEMIRGRKTR